MADSGLLIKGVNKKTIGNEKKTKKQQQQQSKRIFGVLLNSLGTTLLGSMLPCKGVTTTIHKGQGVKKAGYRFMPAGEGLTVRVGQKF